MESKILIVIPAFNEEQNIKYVIDEIKEEFKEEVDIVVINDCSKDNTKIIVEQEQIHCITLPYNMGYSLAVQTGIKYAYKNNYDYVIQFDADRQHIAKEARKLIEKMQKEKCDIVIGSRYLKESEYEYSVSRKIGTKIFSKLVKLICKKEITDPLSGFQIINKKAIKRFSKMGNYPEFPDANLIIELLLDGYKIEEIPVKMRIREFGVSMHRGILRPIKYMIKVLYTIAIIILQNTFRRNIKE